MGTIIVEQFNPESKYWNKLYEVDEAGFDINAPIIINKYNGPYRTRLVGSPIIDKVIIEKSTKKKVKNKKLKVPKGRFTRTIKDDTAWDQM